MSQGLLKEVAQRCVDVDVKSLSLKRTPLGELAS
jgi:hypothetical protein